MAAQQDKIWYFDVSDPTNHPKGFTIYKITSKVFPVNIPENLTEIVVWKRYNDFKQLFKSMFALHKALYRRDEFPAFAKPKLFGRFDEAVIEERRCSALELLNFIGRQPHLYKSQIFIKFLEGGKVVEGLSGKVLKPSKLDILASTQDTLPPPELKPTIAAVSEEDNKDAQKDSGQTINGSSDITQSENGDTELEGVWKFPQVPDNISLNSYDDDTDATDVDSTLGTPLPESELSFFDPLSKDKAEGETSLRTSKSWLFDAINTCAEMEKDDLPPVTENTTDQGGGLQMKAEERSNIPDNLSDSTADTLTQSLGASSTNTSDISEFDPLTQSQSSTGSRSKVTWGKGDLDISQLTASFRSGSSSSLESSTSSVTSTPQKKKPAGSSPFRQRSITKESVSTMDLGGKEDYIYTAANQICLAQEYEANGNYEMAFATYKSCVGILLQGVQADKNKSRRDAVRRKTAQYLMKAEDLYNRHLAKDTSDEKRWAIDSNLNPSTEVDPALAFLRGSVSDLKKFKVLGTIDNVILVLDKNTEETFVIKRICKSSVGNRNKPNIMPTSCPYMVKLYKFYETSSTIYLLLQYASGGKLWDYVGAYLQYAQNQSKENGPGGVNHAYSNQKLQNVYTGYKVHLHDDKVKPTGSVVNDTDIHETVMENVSSNNGNVDQDIIEVEKLENQVRFTKHSEDVTLDLNSCDFQFDDEGLTIKDDDNTFLTDLVLDENVIDENDASAISENDENCDTNQKVQYQRYTSFSSEEIDESDIITSPAPLERQNSQGLGQFQDILQKNKSTLENFSINSFDSGEGVPRMDSQGALSDHIEVIHEVNENGSCDRELIDNDDDIDIVFSDRGNLPDVGDKNNVPVTKDSDNCSNVDKFGENRINNLLDNSNISELRVENDVEFQTDKLKLDSDAEDSSFVNDDEDDIIASSKALLKSVERTLSQIDNDQTVNDNGGQSMDDDQTNDDKERAQSKTSKTETGDYSGPSIYDINRSPDTSVSPDSTSEKSPTRPQSLELPEKSNLKSDKQNPTSDTTISPSPVIESEKTSSQLPSDKPRSSSLCSNHPLVRLNSGELSRSASSDSELKSPLKSRQRTISHMFEQLDMSAANPEQIRIPESFIKRWAAEIIVAVSRLHSLGIICRELKPGNILLGDQGHATLTYFCQINQVNDYLDFEAMHNLYVAPEVRCIGGYNEVCDWWSLGALLYELLVGKTLLSCHPEGITAHSHLYIPEHLSSEAKGLLRELLHFNPRERLGSGMNGAEDIKAHPFFHGIDWNSMEM